MRQAGLVVITGSRLGGPRVYEAAGDAGAGDDVRLALSGTPDDGARVRDALRLAEAESAKGPVLLLLSYEACVSLDARAPRKPRAPALGPDVLVRALRARDARGGEGPAGGVPGASLAATFGLDAQAASPPRSRQRDGAHDAHVERVRAAREHLLDGVIYQANLAHRLVVEPATFAEGLAFFLARDAPCAALVDVPGWGSIVSLSPERFVSVDVEGEGRVARAFPIKGTRPRSVHGEEDRRLLAELCASEKDRAEHVMIVDLLRNDLGKVAVAGGVTVERLLEVISVKNVHHLESTVAARLRPDVGLAELLEATAPGGSITGAPKSSAVEVICALEDGPRGPYTGVLALLDRGTLRSSLLIRTWLRPDQGEGALHVGGGIVVDSEPEAEWQETLDKAGAFAR